MAQRIRVGHMHVGQYIKHLRLVKEPSWTLEKLGALTGLSVSYLSDIERGKADPSLESLAKLGNAFNMGAGDLLVGAGYTTNPALTWQCDMLVRVVCQEGQLSFEPIQNERSPLS